MIRRAVVTFIMILCCFVLQTSVFSLFEFSGCTPNVLLILTVSMGLMRGDVTGMVTGFFCGLTADIFSSWPIGFYAMIYMYTGFISGKFLRRFYPENVVMPLAIIAASDAAFGLISYFFMFALRLKFNVIYYLTHVIIPGVIYTLIVSIVIYPVILRINTWLEDIERRSAKKFV